PRRPRRHRLSLRPVEDGDIVRAVCRARHREGALRLEPAEPLVRPLTRARRARPLRLDRAAAHRHAQASPDPTTLETELKLERPRRRRRNRTRATFRRLNAHFYAVRPGIVLWWISVACLNDRW